MLVRISYRYGEEACASLPVENLAHFVLDSEEMPDCTEVSICFVSDDEIAQLNKEYRDIDDPTDVLSFECDGEEIDFSDPEAFRTFDAPIFELGDIVIAVDVAARQADEYGNSFEDEVSLLLVHGLLHLCGYDHIDDGDAVIMQAREAYLLEEWKANGDKTGSAQSDNDGITTGHMPNTQATGDDTHSRFVRNDSDKAPGNHLTLKAAFTYAAHGFSYAFSTQRNMKVYLGFVIAALVLSALLGLDATQWAIIVLCIAGVLALECTNTAIESITDLVSPEYARLAKIAKDCAAGAVLVFSLASLVIAGILFIPHVIRLFL